MYAEKLGTKLSPDASEDITRNQNFFGFTKYLTYLIVRIQPALTRTFRIPRNFGFVHGF
jgi:hypothetical protein